MTLHVTINYGSLLASTRSPGMVTAWHVQLARKGQTVRNKVGFIFLHDNDDAFFVHGDSEVKVKSNTLVVFDGWVHHHTVLYSDEVKILGPFTSVGDSLSLVGNGGVITFSPLPPPEPSSSPSMMPSLRPSGTPSHTPTQSPTPKPTKSPTKSPTAQPTKPPTKSPTAQPTKQPTPQPTRSPTKSPTARPTRRPTRVMDSMKMKGKGSMRA
jgi:hypothetical protein